MSKYKELVKSFDNIRKLSQNFFIYGYNGRGDFSFLSDRGYDNELRRVKSYLKNYVKTTNLKNKKTISISSDTLYNTKNPLFSLFLSKSFTNIDCFLHFVILDILSTYQEYTLNEIIDEFYNSYEFDEVDDMTIRNKLHEYVDLGIILLNKQNNKNYYLLKKEYKLSEYLIDAILFYQNIIPAGYIVEPLIEKYQNNFIYKQMFFGNVLDDENVLLILKAINICESLLIKYKGKRNTLSVKGKPLYIEHNLITGRRYVVIQMINNYISKVRLDKIELIESIESSNNIQEPINKNLEYIKIQIKIESNEKYIIDRIYREIGKNNIIDINEDIYEIMLFKESVLDLVPFIRSYFGRIISLESSNDYIIKKMKKDLITTLDYYKEEF